MLIVSAFKNIAIEIETTGKELSIQQAEGKIIATIDNQSPIDLVAGDQVTINFIKAGISLVGTFEVKE